MGLTELVPVPPGINRHPDGTPLGNAKQATMLTLLGNPRADYGTDCRPVTDPRLKRLVVTEAVGPFRVTGLAPAVASLRTVLADIAAAQPALHAALGTAGMLCARLVRNSPTAISNHAWGTAIDLTLEGRLDQRGDGRVQHGLTLIAPIFNRHGWFWGAAFGTEDAMHFECGDALIRDWARQGGFAEGFGPGASAGTAGPKPLPPTLLSLGDRGPEVVALQQALNRAGAGLLADGILGRDTQSAIMAFQARHGLDINGVAGATTLAALARFGA